MLLDTEVFDVTLLLCVTSLGETRAADSCKQSCCSADISAVNKLCAVPSHPAATLDFLLNRVLTSRTFCSDRALPLLPSENFSTEQARL